MRSHDPSAPPLAASPAPSTPAAAAAPDEDKDKHKDGDALAPAQWSLPFPAVPPRRPKKRRNRSGWGPFRSVVRERSVNFNLTLDVQQLQQEVQHLEAVRSALRLKALNLRHAPDGSLMQTVREYFRLFRRGYCVHGDPPGGASAAGRIRESEQRAFIFSVMDEALDCGNGLFGPQVMVEQITNYSTFLRYISFDLDTFEIVTAEDSVVITTHATLRFQILRTTIAMIFPHVMGNEALVARLVGQELAPVGKISFYFNAKDKCERYTAELDFAALFFVLLDDPRDVDILMGRALIADNSMFGIDKPHQDARLQPQPVASLLDERGDGRDGFSLQQTSDSDQCPRESYQHREDGGVSENAAINSRYVDVERHQQQSWYDQPDDEEWATHRQMQQAPPHARERATLHDSAASIYDNSEWVRLPAKSSRVDLVSIVDEYFAVFSATSSVDNHGYIQPIGEVRKREQWEFLSSFISSDARCGVHQHVGARGLLRQWETLRAVFHVASFRQVAPNTAMYDPVDNSYVIRTVGEYRLQCTPRTLEVVFPRALPESALGRILLTRQLVVVTDLGFHMPADNGKVTRVTERMGLEDAVASVVPDPQACAALLSRSRLTKDGQLPEMLDWSEDDAAPAQFSLHGLW